MKPEQVRALRAERGQTAQQAADAVGVHIRTWYRWELGEVPPDLARLELYEMRVPKVKRKMR